MSCASATSPISSTTGVPVAAATPNAVETVPSIPFAPRLASTSGRLSLTGANSSTSRIGIEEATNRVASAGSHSSSRAATSGSESWSPSSAAIASPAAASAARQPSSQPGSTSRCSGCGRALRSRIPTTPAGSCHVAVRVERDLRNVREARRATCAAAWRSADRRPGRRTRGGGRRRTPGRAAAGRSGRSRPRRAGRRTAGRQAAGSRRARRTAARPPADPGCPRRRRSAGDPTGAARGRAPAPGGAGGSTITYGWPSPRAVGSAGSGSSSTSGSRSGKLRWTGPGRPSSAVQ